MFDMLCVVVALPIIASVIDATCRRANVPRKDLACDLGVSESFLSRALSGESGKHIPLDALVAKCDRSVIAALGESLLELAGVEPPLTLTDLRAELDARLAFIRPRMLRVMHARKEGVA